LYSIPPESLDQRRNLVYSALDDELTRDVEIGITVRFITIDKPQFRLSSNAIHGRPLIPAE
jgi:hypothetical protein